jgi:hypothetical protein
MGTISDKLMRIINTKEDIRQALISKGYDVPTSIPFKEYAKMILDLPCNADSFPDIEGIVARYSALGLTNEQMAENPVWKDLTGNGHDLQMKNLAWGGMSGVGGYSDNFSSDSWKKPSDRSDITWTSSSFNITRVMNTGVQIYYFSAWEESESVIPEKRIIVKGLEDGQVLRYMNVGNRIIEISQDGIYTIPSFTFKGANSYHGYSLAKKQESCNVTVEQLPLYPGALVFDGVDDYGTCDNFPILTKEKGFTIVAVRQFISDKISSLLSKWTVADESGAFIFEGTSAAGTKFSSAFGGNFHGLEKTILSYMTSTSYNGNTIVPGDKKDINNNLVVGRFYSDLNAHYVNSAIWEIVILDHDATEEELTKIKDYFVKTYPWLFPDQAWTVTGKTNEDEDRATIANITGNGNNLVLSNFGFAEGSGYGLYAYNFNSFNLKDNVVKPTDVKKDSFRIIGTGDNSNVLVLSNTSNSADWKIRITGMKEGDRCLIGNANKSGEYISVNKDGTYTFQKQYVATSTNGIWYNSSQEVDVLVEQIPEYEGYLVTDGVDDEVRSAAFTLNEDWTIVGNWEFITNENKNAGLAKVYSLYLYNRDYGIFVYKYINAGQGFSVEDVKSLKAICSDGRIYLNDWQEIRNNIEQEATISKGVMAIGYFNRDFTKMAFKNLGIYNNQLLSKDDCIKAYNYLQTLKSK